LKGKSSRKLGGLTGENKQANSINDFDIGNFHAFDMSYDMIFDVARDM
jgi:hypothetical protein